MKNSSNNSTNDINCNHESPIPPAMQFAIGVLGNGIALLVLKLSAKTHQWRPFYRLVAALALTDGGGILLVYPSVMIRYAVTCFQMPPALCDYSSFIYTFTLLASAMIICGMSVDRFLAIMYPTFYNTNTKYRRVNIMLGVTWISSAVLCSLHLFGLGDSHSFYPKSWCFIDFSNVTSNDSTAILNRANSFLYSLIGLIIIVTTVSLNSTVVFTICRKRCLQKETRMQNNDSKRDIFNIVFLLTIVVVFASLWTPLICVIFAHAVFWMDGDGGTELLVLRLAVTNSIIDPWIYILLRKETILSVKRIFNRAICCKLSYGMNSRSLDISRERTCSMTSYRRSDGSQGAPVWLTDQEST
ncbi:prostaglandin E2 receptor EP4 subtype-like [Saccostrea echinata]|uniref:prostaglandin E2 receptor EP4 subtype-like n=1 Tax=Saccostrea echinata TaxID=191078 RepID=UPI002A82D19E|nr:prostaglandin E2 receptor EP4 subtype-like [Saccostrea echinata]